MGRVPHVAFALVAAVAVGSVSAASVGGKNNNNNQFNLVLLTDTPDAVCLDGSPGGFYMREGAGEGVFGASTWIIELEGGGWCVSEGDCVNRAYTDIGSSKGWPAVGIPGMDGGANGMLSPNCSSNAFCNATMVHMNYCDGGSFANSMAAPVPTNNISLYYRGANIFDATFQQLLARGLANATNVILKGCSAGGLATYLHADYFFDLMAAAAPKARVVAMPDAGFFRDHVDYAGQPRYTPLYQWVYSGQNVTQVDKTCLEHYTPTGDTWRCFFAEYTLPFITTPLFVTQDLVDSWQLQNIMDMPCEPYTPGACNATAMAAVQEYRLSMLTALKPLLVSPTNGAFLSSCVQHCHQNIDQVFNDEIVASQNVQETFLNWWTGQHALAWQVVDGPYGGNTHCFGVPYEDVC